MFLYSVNQKTGKKFRITIPDHPVQFGMGMDLSISSAGGDSVSTTGDSYDTFESYTIGADLNGLSGYVANVLPSASLFNGSYIDRTAYYGVVAEENFQTYSTGSALNTLSGGTGVFSGAYVDKDAYYGVVASDNFLSYAYNSDLNGVTNGSGVWNGPYVSR